MTRARAVLTKSPSIRRSVTSCPAVSFSSRRNTPPLRLTSSVSAICFTAAPSLLVHEASTGIRKLTRSLCRSPSLRIVSSSIRDFCHLRLAPPFAPGAPSSVHFVVPTNILCSCAPRPAKRPRLLPFRSAFSYRFPYFLASLAPLLVGGEGSPHHPDSLFPVPSHSGQPNFHERPNHRWCVAKNKPPRPPLCHPFSVRCRRGGPRSGIRRPLRRHHLG